MDCITVVVFETDCSSRNIWESIGNSVPMVMKLRVQTDCSVPYVWLPLNTVCSTIMAIIAWKR